MATNTTIIVNELLAFLQQKLDVMDEVSAVQICKTNFSEEDISEAKLLLFTTLNMKEKMVSRRRDGTPKSIQDIITLLKETDPDDVPTFVAKDLNKLPPVTFDHVDVTRLLKDIVLLKASLANIEAKFEASQKTVVELRDEVIALRNSTTVIGSPADDAKVNTRRGVGGASVDLSGSSFESAVLSPLEPAAPALPTPDTYAARIGAAARPRDSAPAPRPPPRAPCPPIQAARSSARTAPATQNRAPKPRQQSRTEASTPHENVVSKLTSAPAADRDDEGFVTVQKKSRRRAAQNQCGTAVTGPNAPLRAEIPTTALYLSRLHYTVSASDVVEYVRSAKQYTLRVQLLESRHERTFNSFVVLVPTEDLETFTDVQFWPKGVVFRRFRGHPRMRAAADVTTQNGT